MANGVFGNKRDEGHEAIEEGLADRAAELAEESLEKLLAEADQYAEDIEQTNLYDSRWGSDIEEEDDDDGSFYDVDERIDDGFFEDRPWLNDDCPWSDEPVDYNRHSSEQAQVALGASGRDTEER